MIEIDRIKELSESEGLSLSYITRKLGFKSRTYFIDIEKRKSKIPDDKLNEIAHLLNTTTDYLKGITDIKEKSPSSEIDERLLLEFNKLSDADKDEILEKMREMISGK